MNDPTDAIGEYIRLLRDQQRPRLEDVVETVTIAFANIYGPGTEAPRMVTEGEGGSWMWEDLSIPSFPKYFIISSATADGIEGYPLFTVRQAFSVKLDTWVTLSAIVPGVGNAGIARTMALLVAQHAAAFAAVKLSTEAVADSGGEIKAAVLIASHLMTMDVPTLKEMSAKLPPIPPIPSRKSDDDGGLN